MDLMGIGFRFLLEAKLTDGVCTRHSSGCHMQATEAPSPHQGVIASFHKDSPRWQVKSVCLHGPNLISCVLVTGSRRCGVVGACIPPTDLSALDQITHALDRLPQDCVPVLLGDLNVDFMDLRDQQDHTIANKIVTRGFDNLLLHFRQCRCCRHRQTWFQSCQGESVSSRCDHISCMERCPFRNAALHAPCLFGLDHLLIFADLTLLPFSEHRLCTKGRTCMPLKMP